MHRREVNNSNHVHMLMCVFHVTYLRMQMAICIYFVAVIYSIVSCFYHHMYMHISHHLTLDYYEHKIRNFMYLYSYVIVISHDKLFVSLPGCLHHRLHHAGVLNIVPVVHPT